MMVGTAVGPSLFGRVFRLFRGYQQILTFSLLLPAASAVIALVSRPPVLARAPAGAAAEGVAAPQLLDGSGPRVRLAHRDGGPRRGPHPECRLPFDATQPRKRAPGSTHTSFTHTAQGR